MDPQIYSDNSSPRSFHSSLDVSSYSYSPAYPLSKKNSYSFSAPIPLQVSTSTSSLHDQDPNERTARPGNAHAHTQFHHSLASLNAPEPDHSESTEPSNEEPFSCVAAGITGGLSRPLKPHERERLAHLDKLKFFLATAPSRWDSSASPTNPNSSGSAASASSSTNSFPVSSQFGNAYPGDSAIPGTTGNAAAYHAPPHPALNRFLLPSQEFVTCVLWNGLYHITGTDIVRALVFRFEAFGRPVRNMKKFEEGVFSDLRNLKPGVDACLEDPKSPFLDLLFKYQCIRTQKKQKVFYWFSVPHDRLFLDALERDLKREKMGMAPTTEVVGEPALSFTYDPKKSLYEQFSKAQGAREGEGELEAAVRRATETGSIDGEDSMAMEGVSSQGSGDPADESEGVSNSEDGDGDIPSSVQRRKKRVSCVRGPNEPPVFAMFSLFEGSSRYKQRRKRNAKMGGPDPGSLVRRGSEDLMDERGRARSTGLGPGGRYAASSASVSRERGPMGMGMNMGMMGVHPSMMDEFGPHIKADADDAMTAAQMFIKQAHGQLVPADGVVRKPRMQSSVGEVGVYYSEGNPDHAIQPQSSFGDIHLHRHSYPGPVLQHPTLSGSFDGNGIAPFTQTQSHLHPQQQTVESNNSVYEVVDGKTKAFVCHLETCGRLFKRMEHLKRHLRTHTLERPFACTRCRKRFSRSDNLNQHLRTHERVGMSGISSSNGSGGAGLNSGANMNGGIVDWGEEDGDTGEEGSGGSGGHASEGESEDEGVHGMVGYSGGMYAPGTMDMDSMNLGVNPGMGMPLNTFGIMDGLDMQMREADVRDGSEQPLGVQSGQEGGAGANSGSGGQDVYSFSSGNPSAPTNGMMFSSGNGIGPSDFTQEAQWSRPQPSPAFSSVSIPSPPPGPHNGTYAQHIRNNRSISSMRHHTPSHSTSSSAASSVYGGDEFEYDYEYSTSISAPSHKRSFDQNGMFTGLGLMDTGVPGVPASMVAGTSPSAASVASGATGPIRRHRSMTPSLIRSGDQPLRRPMTASNGDLAAAASVSNPTGSANGGSGGGSPSGMSSARGYHPYAPYGTVSTTSRPGSSSPGAYSMQVGAPRRSESRNSSFGAHGAGVGVPAEQISQLMRISLDGGQGQQQQQQQQGDQQHQTSMYGDSSYRTDSPSTFQQTESPAPYAIDLPMQFGGGSAGGPGGSNHRHSAPVIYGEHEQFGAQQQQQQQHYPSSAPHAGIGDGFYSAHPQQHITL